MSASKKAIVIGAGGAGLAALHALNQASFDVVAFEKNDTMGGVWATTLYPSLTIHSQSFNYRFHDYPPAPSAGPSATRDEIRAYFSAFARDVGIGAKIVHRRRVDRIVYRPHLATGRCLVVAVDTASGDRSEHPCDVVVCATGFSNAGRPHVPAFAGRESSAVRVLHSSALTPEVFDDIVRRRRKVVVLGAGKSAHEILWLFRDTGNLSNVTWVYVKSLWSLQYEVLYSTSAIPTNVFWYLYYAALASARRRFGYGAAMRMLQAPLRWSGLLVNPLEPDSDVCVNRTAIMKAEQLAFLKTVRSVKAGVVRLSDRAVELDNGDAIEADALICATGYDRAIDLPRVDVQAPDGTVVRHDLAAQPGFYRQMVDVAAPEISLLAANVLYPQQLLGYSLGAAWLARFHRNELARQPTRAAMERAVAVEAAQFSRWSSGEYLSGGQPYAHQRNEHVLPRLFADMGLAPSLARSLVTSGANPRKFARLCDTIAARLAQGGGGR